MTVTWRKQGGGSALRRTAHWLAGAGLWALTHAIVWAPAAAHAGPPAALPPEEFSTQRLPPADPFRIYLVDPVLPHLVDGRVHVIDGTTMHYLGMVGTGFAGATTLSRDRRSLFVATTYHSRLQRGTRTDVVEVYGSSDLDFQYEIEIPPKHLQGLQNRALLTTTADDRFLLIQNATPATSVSVVDLVARRFVAEVPMPGCYGAIAWPDQPRRFSAVCGNGSLATYVLDDTGNLSTSSVTEPFFDPDRDPVFIHYALVGNRLSFVSYHGDVYSLDLQGDRPVVLAAWPLLDAVTRKEQWRPGGLELFAIEPGRDRLYVGMHPHGAEGSHKNPAQELWVFDMKTQRRLARVPGHGAVSMAVSRNAVPRLFVLSGNDNRLLSFDLSGATPPRKPLAQSAPVGETPAYLEMH